MAKQTFTVGQVLTAAQMTDLQATAMGGGSPIVKTASYVLVAADAGTVIQMNSASSTTITVNTALFSAGDSVQIQNIGAGVCTITAGTATVTTAGSLALSQWEGGTLYFTSTSASIFFDIVQTSGMTNPMTTTGDTIYSSSGSTPARLGIGTSGQVLTVSGGGIPSWATSASGGMTLLSTTTLSGSSTTISSISGSYTSLFILVSGVNQSASARLRLAPNNATTSSTSIYISTNNTSVGEIPVFISEYIALTPRNFLVNGNTANSFTVLIDNYASSTAHKPFELYGSFNDDASKLAPVIGGGSFRDNTAITSLVFSPSSGTFSAGTVLVYGVK